MEISNSAIQKILIIPQKIGKNHMYVISTRKLILNYARSSGMFPHIKCDPTVHCLLFISDNTEGDE
jgi:hypothetical protein